MELLSAKLLKETALIDHSKVFFQVNFSYKTGMLPFRGGPGKVSQVPETESAFATHFRQTASPSIRRMNTAPTTGRA